MLPVTAIDLYIFATLIKFDSFIRQNLKFHSLFVQLYVCMYGDINRHIAHKCFPVEHKYKKSRVRG